MAKSAEGKKTKRIASSGKLGRTIDNRAAIVEYVSCLLELHNLQGVLLTKLDKIIHEKLSAS